MDQRIDRRGLVWQLAGDYLTATCYGSPRAAVYESMLDWVRDSGVRVAGVVFEDRRGPLEATRLARIAALGRALDVPVVLLTGSPLVWVAARLQRWRGHEIHTCGVSAVDAALTRLAVPDAQRATVKAAVHALRVARALGRSRRRRSSDSSSHTPIPVA